MPARLYRFGTFELDLGRDELRREGLRVKLRGRPLDLLAALLERPGELVGRDELRDRLWAADTFVDFDHGLNSSVNRLREALGDTAENPRFVETVPRKGYRFIAPVALAPAGAAAAPGSPAAGARPPAGPALAAGRRARIRAMVLAAAAAGGLALLALAAPWSRPAPPPRPPGPLRLAVLPFVNLSNDTDDDHLADGMTDVLITELSQLHSLEVLSRTTAMAYKGRGLPLSEIARELGLEVAVEGSLLLAGDRARINAQLVDTRADHSLWARSYDCDVVDLIDVQRRVAREITESVSVAVTENERRMLQRSSPLGREALEVYVRGRLARERLTAAALAESRAAFTRATELAPGYAPAWAALADVYRVSGAAGYDVADPGQSTALARDAARRALDLDPEEPLANAVLGMVAFSFDWDWTEAERYLTRSLALSPSSADVHVWYSGFLTAMGRLEEGIAAARRARELDPLSARPHQTVGYRLYYARRLPEAEATFRDVLRDEPGSFAARLGLGLTLWQQRDAEAALRELERASVESAANTWALGSYGQVLAEAGRTDEARAVLERLKSLAREQHVSPYTTALVRVGLGENAAALDDLERAYDEHSGWVPYLAVEPAMAPLRGEPRFVELLERVGLGAD